MKPLTEKEEEIMRKLWTKDEMIAREVWELFPEPRPHFNTVATFLRILENKGWVKHRPVGNTHLYMAAVSEEEMGRMSLKNIASKFFNGSMGAMVDAILKDENISKEEIEKIAALVRNRNKTKVKK